MSQVGVYLSAPMLVAFFGKIFVAAYESFLRSNPLKFLSFPLAMRTHYVNNPWLTRIFC